MKILGGLFWFIVCPILLTIGFGLLFVFNIFTHTFALGSRSEYTGPSSIFAYIWLSSYIVSFYLGYRVVRDKKKDKSVSNDTVEDK